jgi:hypothetical protein
MEIEMHKSAGKQKSISGLTFPEMLMQASTVRTRAIRQAASPTQSGFDPSPTPPKTT